MSHRTKGVLLAVLWLGVAVVAAYALVSGFFGMWLLYPLAVLALPLSLATERWAEGRLDRRRVNRTLLLWLPLAVAAVLLVVATVIESGMLTIAALYLTIPVALFYAYVLFVNGRLLARGLQQ
jgi:ABC-type transport system involved in cytochrome c biogenesis permease subunit